MKAGEHDGKCLCPEPVVTDDKLKCKLCGGISPIIINKEVKTNGRTRKSKKE